MNFQSANWLYVLYVKNFFSEMAQISDMGEGGNFRFLIWQKSYEGAAFGSIRGPIGSLINFGALWALGLTNSACFYAHGIICNKLNS